MMRHKQGNAGVRPDDCRGLYDGAADVKSAVLSFIGKPKSDKLRGSGQRPEALRYEPVGEEYHYLAVSQCPVSRRHCPLFCDFLAENPVLNLTVLVKTSKNQELLKQTALFTADYPIPESGTAYYLCENGACMPPVYELAPLYEKLVR